MTILASFSREGRIGLHCIDNPLVNALSPPTVAGLIDGFNQFEAASELEALVIYGADRTFVAGADITSFELPDFSAKPYNDLLARIEGSRRPVVAAMHGTALGGGLELALACHGVSRNRAPSWGYRRSSSA
jgi:3-hydroxyacyl-CoA dehydrogenase